MLYTLGFVSGPVASALVTDLVPPQSLGRGLALYNATSWLGGIAGCALTGYGVQCVGTTPTLLAGACVPLLATGLLASIGRRRHAAAGAAGHKQPVPPVELLPARA